MENKTNEEEEINKNNNVNNEEQDENSINIYDDNAYMLGEEDSENNNSPNIDQIKEDEIHYQNQDKNENFQKENEIQGLDDAQNEDNQEKNNNYIKLIENQEKNNIDNQTNNNNTNNIGINKNLNNDEKNNNIEENNPEDGEEQEELDEENMPLVTLKYISVCQCCKNQFDSKNHLPYLFKCGHFFCKECIDEQFTDEEGIKCPIDGLIAKSFKEFKLLNNLITDKTIPSQRSNINNNENNNLKNTCQIHKGQKLTHIVVNTKEIVCVYCAFDLVRRNPNCEVRELKEKFSEYYNIADKIINLNQNNVEIIQKSLKDIKDNKKREEKKVIFYFEHIFKYINTKKEEILSKIDSIFTENATKLSQKLENFSTQIEVGENLKALVNEFNKNNNYGYNDIYDSYLKLESLHESEKNNKINLQEFKFIHDDETKMIKYINNFGDIKSIYKYIPFHGDAKDIFELNNMVNENCYKENNLFNINNCINSEIESEDINNNMKRNINNNKYYINNLMLNKNKSFVLTNKKDNLNLLDNDIEDNICNLNYNNNFIHTLNNNNIKRSNYNLRINSNPKLFLNSPNNQKINKNYKNLCINNNLINDNNVNYMNFNLNNDKEKQYKDYDYFNNNNKFNRKEFNSSKRINQNNNFKDNRKGNLESFHRISSPATYTYDFKRINK